MPNFIEDGNGDGINEYFEFVNAFKNHALELGEIRYLWNVVDVKKEN